MEIAFAVFKVKVPDIYGAFYIAFGVSCEIGHAFHGYSRKGIPFVKIECCNIGIDYIGIEVVI
ncbi:hypothetical protein SDC9_83085 [bioreactor metagenome]|uniref:Uncharacterized protein n=1 Tax=bioreactor metagenome TaxID=1076179 RepID=A0A644Z787_9ZZZZ